MSMFNQQLKQLSATPVAPRSMALAGGGPVSTAAPSPQRRARAADAEKAARRALAERQERDSIAAFREEMAKEKAAPAPATPKTPWSYISPVVAVLYGALAVIGTVIGLMYMYPELSNPLIVLHGGGVAPSWLAWAVLAFMVAIGIFFFELRSVMSGMGMVLGGAVGAVFMLYAMFQWPDVGAQFLTPDVMAAAQTQKSQAGADMTPVEVYLATAFNG